jgi:pyruvate/2-oxoglutarate dehydrogenase complex dihydrolipoamide acyltransferase (E2) component
MTMPGSSVSSDPRHGGRQNGQAPAPVGVAEVLAWDPDRAARLLDDAERLTQSMTDPYGRALTLRDIAKAWSLPQLQTQQYTLPTPLHGAGEGPYITPLVRRLAAEHGVDLAAVEGTGAAGRIRKQDVLEAARATRQRAGNSSSPSWLGKESGRPALTSKACGMGTAGHSDCCAAATPCGGAATCTRSSPSR